MSNVGLGIQVYSWIAKAFPFYSFFFGSNLRFGGLQSTLTRVYTLANRRFFPRFSSTRRKCGRLSRFCFMSRLQGVRICGVFVGGDSNYRLI